MTTRKAKSKQVPPARARYEASHPTVTVRISRGLQQELEELKITSGLYGGHPKGWLGQAQAGR